MAGQAPKLGKTQGQCDLEPGEANICRFRLSRSQSPAVLLPIRGHEPCRGPAWLWKPNVGDSYALSHAWERALVGHVARGGFLFPILFLHICILSWACRKVGWVLEGGQALTSGILAEKQNRGKRWMGHSATSAGLTEAVYQRGPSLRAAWEEGREFRANPAALSLSNSENSTTGSHTTTKQKSGTIYAQNTLHMLSHIRSHSIFTVTLQ